MLWYENRLTKRVNLDKGKPSFCEPEHRVEYTTNDKHAAINKLGEVEDVLAKHKVGNALSLDNQLCGCEVLNGLGKKIKAQCMCDLISYVEDRVKIEKELGIDLITLFKALNGIYYTKNAINWYLDCLKENVIYKAEGEDIHIQLCGNKDKYSATILVYVSQRNAYYSLKIADYGKTWALTKEELEHGKPKDR